MSPVATKHECKRFIDYQYDRHRGGAHFMPPLRLGDIEKLTPRKNKRVELSLQTHRIYQKALL